MLTRMQDKEKGDASRVLVLAATNMPWAIDDAARRRFVRRQYIPLPERETRAVQLKTLLGHQKHSLKGEEFDKLVDMTDGTSPFLIFPPSTSAPPHTLPFRAYRESAFPSSVSVRSATCQGPR